MIVLVGCGSSVPRATTPRPMPEDTEDRHDAMDAFGRQLHAALIAGRPTDVMFGDDELRLLMSSSAATRVAARRASITVRLGRVGRAADGLAHTEYLGVCLQDSRGDDPALGVRGEGWTFRRVLVAARQPAGRRIALWVDGVFLFTDDGFGALDLERVEDPRWEHSDLEIAPCDMATQLE